MNRKTFGKLIFVFVLLVIAVACSNYFGLSIAEREELKVKDLPALTVNRLPSILPCEYVDDHYEVEVLFIPEQNTRFPKPTDKYMLNFDAYVTNEVKITGLKASMKGMSFFSFDIPLSAPITSKNGRVSVNQEIVLPEDNPNFRFALRNVRIVAIVECEAKDGLTFTLTDSSKEHIESDNVEIEYVTPKTPVVEVGEVALTFKNADGSVFTTLVGKIGDMITLPSEIPVWRGHVFAKWRDVPKVFPQTNAEYESVWELETYYIDYELYGGENSRGNFDSYTVEDPSLKLYPPTRGTSIFCGWYGDPEFNSPVTAIQTSLAADVTLYAKWLDSVVGQITLFASTPVVVGGQQGKILSYLKMPDGTMPELEWSCSDPSLATVNRDGTVATNIVPFDKSESAKCIKKIYITASYKNLKANCELTVIPTTLTKEIFAAVWQDYSSIFLNIPYGIETIAAKTFYETKLKDIVMPSTLKTIEEEAFYRSAVATAEIPDNVTYIGDSAFFSCANLNTPKLPKNLEYLGKSAFRSCNFVGPIEIYGNNATIGSYAFYGCKNLEGVKIEDGVKTIGEGAFYSCSSLKSVEMADSVVRIEDCAFYYDSNLVECNLSQGLEYIGESVFYVCTSLKGPVELSKNLKNLGRWAFYNCSSLTGTVTIPSGVETIGKSTFCNCSSLESVKIEDGVKTIGEYAFYGCSSLKSVEMADSVVRIEDWAFEYDSNLVECNLSQGLEYIGESVFYDCTSLKGPVELSKNLKNLGRWAFYNCSSLTGTVTIPSGIETIGKSTFYKCSSLEGVKFEEGVESIGEYAFEYCSSLKGPLVLPKSLKTIDNYAFYDSPSIKEVKIYANGSLESIAPTAFTKSVFTVTITGTLSSYDAERWNKNILYGFYDLVELKLENAPAYVTIDGALYSADKTRLVYVPRGMTTDIDTSDNTPMFTIPDDVTHIGDYALYGRNYRIHWPGNCQIVSYGDYCFAATNWKSMTIVSTTKFVGKGVVEDSRLQEGVKFMTPTGWYYTTNPNATSGTAVDVSDIMVNATNLKAGGAWADGYLKR